jgi:hypothetical protein
MFAGSDDDDGGFFQGGGGEVGFSFAHLEKKAAQDTGNMLRELENTLYDAPIIILLPTGEVT